MQTLFPRTLSFLFGTAIAVLAAQGCGDDEATGDDDDGTGGMGGTGGLPVTVSGPGSSTGTMASSSTTTATTTGGVMTTSSSTGMGGMGTGGAGGGMGTGGAGGTMGTGGAGGMGTGGAGGMGTGGAGGGMGTGGMGAGGMGTGGMGAGGMGTGGMGGMGAGGMGAGGMGAGGMGTGGAGGGGTVVTVLNEPFVNDAAFVKLDGNGSVAAFFSDGGADYWGITDGATGGNFGGDGAPNLTGDYAGLMGTFLALQDLDGEGLALPAVMQWQSLSIANLTSLQLSFKLAEAAASDQNDDMDAGDFLRFEAIVDGGAPVTIFEFRGDANTNGVFREDTDLDGLGDGAVAVGPTAVTFTKPIGLTGTTLTLVVSADLNSGDEDIALDDIVVEGIN